MINRHKMPNITNLWKNANINSTRYCLTSIRTPLLIKQVVTIGVNGVEEREPYKTGELEADIASVESTIKVPKDIKNGTIGLSNPSSEYITKGCKSPSLKDMYTSVLLVHYLQ
jgi:hypothetical protein